MGPYLKRTPRNWFLRTTGPPVSVEAATAEEFVDIFKLLERPGRTIPKNQDEEEEEEEEVREGFIGAWAGPLDYSHDVMVLHLLWYRDSRTKTEDPSKFHIMTEQVTGYVYRVWIRKCHRLATAYFSRACKSCGVWLLLPVTLTRWLNCLLRK